jgi:hypothetical protein
VTLAEYHRPMADVLGTTSNPAGAGLPGIQPDDPTAGIGGMAISSLTDAFTKGLAGPEMPEMMGGGSKLGFAAKFL